MTTTWKTSTRHYETFATATPLSKLATLGIPASSGLLDTAIAYTVPFRPCGTVVSPLRPSSEYSTPDPFSHAT